MSTSTDIASLLLQVKTLEGDREKLNRELDETKKRLTEEQRVAMETKQRMGKLQENKRAEMQNSLDNVIKKWLSEITQDETVKAEFEKGLTRLVENTEEENGVWTVAVGASNAYLRKMQELEQMKDAYEKLQKGAAPEFHSEESRKRIREDAPAEPKCVWDDFASALRSNDFGGRPAEFLPAI